MAETIFASEPQGLACMNELVELALDLRWSWDHSADEIWRPLAPELWDLTRNPWVILQTIAPGKLKEFGPDDKFRTPWKPWPRSCALPTAPQRGSRKPRPRRP